MRGQTHTVIIGISVILIAVFTLFYIFSSLKKIADACSRGEALQICQQIQGLSFPILVILLIVGGLIIVISTVIYILLFA